MFNVIRRLILWLKATFAFRRVKRIERKQFTDEVISSNGTDETFETHEVEIPEGPPTSAETRKAGKRTGLERTAEEESLEEVQIAESQIESTPYQAEEEKGKETETNRPSEQVEISSKDMQERIKTTLTKRKPRTKIQPGELGKAGKLVRDKVKKRPSGREKERDLGHRKTKARKTTKSLDQAPAPTDKDS